MRKRSFGLSWVFLSVLLWGCSGDNGGGRGEANVPPPVRSLGSPVEVFRDEWGIAHVYGHGRGDVLFIQGYEMARDRIFHMDHFRRTVYGTQAEVYGQTWLEDDITKRVLGFRRLAEANLAYLRSRHPELNSYVESFCNGVNAYLEDMKEGRNGAVRPVEFDRIDPAYWPDPWQPVDVVALAKALVASQSFQGPLEMLIYLARFLLFDRYEDLLRFQPLKPTFILEPSATTDFDGSGVLGIRGESGFSQDGAALFSADEPTRRKVAEGLFQMAERLGRAFGKVGLGASGGSNNWVVDDSLNENGACMLCNDPHMTLDIPSILMATHIVDLDEDDTGAVGNIAPGAPMVLIGHTQHLAWGLTNGFGDVTDLYHEKTCDHGKGVSFRGRCVPMEFYEETILVRREGGGLGDTDPVRRTMRWVPHHGPVLNDLLPDDIGPLLELFGLVFTARWPGFSETSTDLVCMKEVLDARTVEDGLRAMRYFNSGVLNWVFADASGNVGYMAAGPWPLRADPVDAMPPYLPLPGDGNHEWKGFRDVSSEPQTLNPAKGYVVTANNTISDQTLDNDPLNDDVYWGHFFDLGARAWRITTRLEALKAAGLFGTDEMRALQTDDHLVLADEFLPLLLECRSLLCEDADAAPCRALALLEQWDRRCGLDSAGAALFGVWYTHFVLRTLQDDIPSFLLGMIGPYLSQVATRDLGAWLAGRGPASGRSYFDDRNTPQVETAADQMAAALEEAVDELSEFFGPERPMETWRWGEVHLKTFSHVVWDDLNLGPFEKTGGLHTVNPAEYSLVQEDGSIPGLPYRQSAEGPAFRFCVEMKPGQWKTYNVLPGGQSGHWGDEHFSDQLPLWLEGRSYPLWYLREDVEAHAESYRLYAAGFPDER